MCTTTAVLKEDNERETPSIRRSSKNIFIIIIIICIANMKVYIIFQAMINFIIHNLKDLPDFSVGKPYPDTDLQIRDPDTFQVLGPNQHGEICVKTPGLFHSYLFNPEVCYRRNNVILRVCKCPLK